jgi:ferric-dicitrate binding protein FerR (iron transport regulator)
MTFRSDHEAALARVDALERALARERDRAAMAEARLAMSERPRKRRTRWRTLPSEQFVLLVAVLMVLALAVPALVAAFG